MKHMTYAIIIYYLSLIFGAVSLPILSGSLLKIVALIIILFWLERKFIVHMTRFNWIFLTYIGVMAFSVLYTLNFSATKQRVITNIQFFLLLVATTCTIFKNYEISCLKKALVWSSRITAIVLIIAGGMGAERLLLNGSILAEDPNYLNGYFIFGVIAAIERLIISNEILKRKILSIIELGVYIYCCLATGSRGGMFCLVAGASVLFLIGREDERRIKTLLKKILLFIVIILSIMVVLPYIPENISSRFTVKAIIESNGTHRYEFWGWAIEIFKSSNIFHMLFGYGAGAIRDIFEAFGYMPVVAHNIYIEQLMEGGIILNIIYIMLLSIIIRASWKRKDYFAISSIVGFIVLSFSTSLYAFKPFWAIMMFVNLRRVDEVSFILSNKNIK